MPRVLRAEEMNEPTLKECMESMMRDMSSATTINTEPRMLPVSQLEYDRLASLVDDERAPECGRKLARMLLSRSVVIPVMPPEVEHISAPVSRVVAEIIEGAMEPKER